jgi:lipoyl(octanoyl) transferase
MKEKILFRDLGLIEYGEAWSFQEELLRQGISIKSAVQAQVREGGHPTDERTSHHLLFCEHPPVFTLGKSGNMEHVLLDEATMKDRGISFFHTNRGGDITFHGPGQLVAYPILDLEYFGTDIGKYLRNLEEVVITVMAEYGLKGERSPGETGVWLDPAIKGRERKICAMGVRCSRWMTMHGLAFNVNTDLSYFDAIVPCGIVGKQVTSLQRELGRILPMDEVRGKMLSGFEAVFGIDVINVDL